MDFVLKIPFTTAHKKKRNNNFSKRFQMKEVGGK